jgi:ABC-type multidrug transport system ATPase subunit
LAELQLYYDSATILDGGKIVYTGISSDLMKMFGDDGFEFETTDDKTIKKYLKKKKIKFIEDGKHGLSIFSNDKNVVLELEKFAVTNDIEIVKMNKISHSLDEIYDKLIIKGSVDTMN